MTVGLAEVVVHIDRCLGLHVSKTVPCGSTVAEVKKQIAHDDPTGQMHFRDIILCDLTGERIDDSHVLTHGLHELELGSSCEQEAHRTDTDSAAPLRIWAISDVHADMNENMAWVQHIASQQETFANDCLLVAGDVANTLDVLVETLSLFKKAFRYVFFVPGNHDLWTEKDLPDSIAKLEAIRGACADLGVLVGPAELPSGGASGGEPVLVVPVLSWYHSSFDTEPPLDPAWEGVTPVSLALRDFQACHWPAPLSMSDSSLAEHFDGLNDAYWAGTPAAERGPRRPYAAVVSFSHFLPRIELCPEKRFLTLPTLLQAVGSRFLGARVEELGPDVHVFGHTHFGWDTVLGGVRYLQAPLGYPAERKRGGLSVAVGRWIPEPSAGAAAGKPPPEPFLVWDGGSGGFTPREPTGWAAFYEHYGRRPEQVRVLPLWVAKRLTWTGPGGAPIGLAGQAPPHHFMERALSNPAIVSKFEAELTEKPTRKELEVAGGGFETLPADELERHIGQEGLEWHIGQQGPAGHPRTHVFDVRPARDFEFSHIPSAISIPFEDMVRLCTMQPPCRRLAVYESLADPDARKVVVCPGDDGTGDAEFAAKAADRLRRVASTHARGFVLLEGGMHDWVRYRRPTVGSMWAVVGGEDQGGILVRTGRAFSSPKAETRLATGSLVRELLLLGERLLYELVSGAGPESGWASLRVNQKELLLPA